MIIGKIVNRLLFPLGYKIVAVQGKASVEEIDPLERNDVKTLEKLWGNPKFRERYLSAERKRLHQIVLAELQGMGIYGQKCRLLDVGCGPSFFPKLLKDSGFEGQISGCDFSAQAISLSSSLIPEGVFFQHDIYDPIAKKYDVIVCMETLEHLLDPEKALLNLSHAAPNLILTVPEGRKDSFRGHLNLWTKQSFEVFLKKTLPKKNITVEEVSEQKNLLATIS